MKKTSLLLALGILIISTTAVLAKNDNPGQQMMDDDSREESTEMMENENQIRVQNQGEDTMMQENVAEKENLGSFVSQKVQELLDDKNLDKGIGQELKQQIQEHKDTEDQIQQKLGVAKQRSGLVKSLIGPDYKALGDAKTQLEQNQMRIQKLEELKLQLTNEADVTLVTETIQAIVDQNTALQDQINAEESTKSLFGWLLKLFVK